MCKHAFSSGDKGITGLLQYTTWGWEGGEGGEREKGENETQGHDMQSSFFLKVCFVKVSALLVQC